MFGNAKNRGSNSIAPLRQDSTISLEVLDSQTIANGGNYSASHRNGKKPVLPEDVSETLRQIMADVTSAGQQANNELDMSLNYLKYLFWKIKKWFFSSRKINKMLNKALVESCSMEFKSFVNPLLKAGADPNGEPGQWGPLHATAFWGGSEIMRILLQHPKTDPDVVNERGRTPLHLAAMKGNYDILEMLLDTNKININATDDDGCTPFHLTGVSTLSDEVSTDILKCVSLFMNRPDLKLNMPCNKGFTALSHAIFHKEIVQSMLKHQNGNLFNVDTFFSRVYGKNIREAIFDTYPELISELPRPLQESTDSPEIAIYVLACLQKGDLFNFKYLLQSKQYSFDINHWYDEPYHCTILEIACQIKNRVEFISALLNVGANPNTINKITMQSVLLLTVKRGNIEGLKELLKSEDINVNIKNAYGNTPLHYLCDIHPSNKTESDLIQQAMQLIVDVSEPKDGEVLNLRLKADLNVTNKDGETPLHVAARMGEKETIFILLRNGANLMKKTANFEPPICSINPSVLESYLDECIEINDYSPLHNDFMLSFDYSFLEHLMEGKTEGKTNKKQNHDPDMVILEFFSKTDQYRYLLKHPVISYFLEIKWKNVGHIYELTTFIYILFVVNLTLINFLFDAHSNIEDDLLGALKFILIIIFSIEAYQIISSFLTYIRKPKKILLWLSFLGSLSLFSGNDQLISETRLSVLFLAWCYFVSLMSSIPLLSVPFQMLKTVIKTVLKYLLCYSPIFFIFGICFFMMFKHSHSEGNEFFSSTIGMSLLKTVIMFAGEFEASNIPFNSAPYLSHFMFIAFVFLITIVLSSLLNGLAISDIQTIEKNAVILSLSSRVNFISDIQKMFLGKTTYGKILKSMLNGKLKIFPNRKNEEELNEMIFSNREIAKDTVKEAISIANKIKKQKHDMNENQRKVEEKITGIERCQQGINTKINEIVTQLDILCATCNEILSYIGTSKPFENRL